MSKAIEQGNLIFPNFSIMNDLKKKLRIFLSSFLLLFLIFYILLLFFIFIHDIDLYFSLRFCKKKYNILVSNYFILVFGILNRGRVENFPTGDLREATCTSLIESATLSRINFAVRVRENNFRIS